MKDFYIMINITTSWLFFQYFQSSEGNVAVVEFLMKQGAGIHMRDRNNDTPLLCAIKSGHNELKSFLKEHLNFHAPEISQNINQTLILQLEEVESILRKNTDSIKKLQGYFYFHSIFK